MAAIGRSRSFHRVFTIFSLASSARRRIDKSGRPSLSIRLRRSIMRVWMFAILGAFVWLPLALAEDQPKPIGPAEAVKRINEEVTLQMEVKSAALQKGVCFLNSLQGCQKLHDLYRQRGPRQVQGGQDRGPCGAVQGQDGAGQGYSHTLPRTPGD